MATDRCKLTERREEYGEEKYQEHLLEQYKLLVEMTDRDIARRLTTNQYFLAIHTGLVTVLGVAGTVGLDALKTGWGFFVPIAGIVICHAWYRLVRSYKGMSDGGVRRDP